MSVAPRKTGEPTAPAAPTRRGRSLWRWRRAVVVGGAAAAVLLGRDGFRARSTPERLHVSGWATLGTVGETTQAPAPAPAEPLEPYFPFLAGESATDSVSVGDTSNGFVVNARQLVEDDAIGILPPQRARHLDFGTEQLIALLEHVARELRTQTSTRLWVGNIGRRGGGDVRYSVSHNSGRDADVALCYRDGRGKPLDPPDLVPLNGVGVSKDGRMFFDAARTWVVVKALLQAEQAQVQYIFLSGSLRKLMLQHAVAHAEPGALVERAAAVVVQPAGAPHNDHLHVRIHCSERDVLGGCVEAGVEHPWATSHESAKKAWLVKVQQALGDARPVERQRAIERLVLLGAEQSASQIAERLFDPDTAVRGAAAVALGALGSPDGVATIAARYPEEDDFAVRVSMLGAVRSIGGGDAALFVDGIVREPAAPWLARLEPPARTVGRWRDPSGSPALVAVAGLRVLAELPPLVWPKAEPVDWRPGEVEPVDEPTRRFALRLLAIDAVGDSAQLAAADGLLAALEEPSPIVRARAALALARLTNTLPGGGWGDASQSAAVRARLVARWRDWVERNRRRPRDGMVAAGFIAAGYRVPEVHQRHLWELVRAASGSDHHCFNAQQALMRLTDHQPPTLERSPQQACSYWLRWLRNRRARFRLEPPPAALLRRCF